MKQSDRRIDWTLDAREVCRLIRGADSQPGVYDILMGKNNRLFSSRIPSTEKQKPHMYIYIICMYVYVFVCVCV